MTGGTWGAKLSVPRVRRMWKAAMSNLLLDEDARGPRNVSLTDQILLERFFKNYFFCGTIEYVRIHIFLLGTCTLGPGVLPCRTTPIPALSTAGGTTKSGHSPQGGRREK